MFLTLVSLCPVGSIAMCQSLVIGKMQVTGHKKTKPFVIFREMNISEGQRIDTAEVASVLKDNRNNIYNLGLFTRVDIKEQILKDTLFLTIHVVERWYIWPQVNLAFEERNFMDWWQDKDFDRLVYGIGVDWKNFTGRDDNLDVYVQNGYSRRISFKYYLPYLFPKVRLDGRIGYRYINRKEVGYGTEEGIMKWGRLQRERMQIQHSGYIEFLKNFTPRKNLKFGASFNHFHASDSIVSFNKRYLTNGSRPEYYPSFFAEYNDDQRDIRSYPLDGRRFLARVSLTGLPWISTARFAKFEVRYSHHVPLSKRWNFAYGTQNIFILGKKVPYFEKGFIGFGNVIRGYERYVIDGSFLNLTKAEMKFAIIPRQMLHWKRIPLKSFRDFPVGLYLTAFSDAGFVLDNTFSNQDDTFKNRLLVGYGAGINVITFYDLTFRFEYSFNHMLQHGFNIHSSVSIR